MNVLVMCGGALLLGVCLVALQVLEFISGPWWLCLVPVATLEVILCLWLLGHMAILTWRRR